MDEQKPPESELEERVSNIEDLEMLNRLDIMQMKDILTKITPEAIKTLDVSSIESRLAALESAKGTSGAERTGFDVTRIDELESNLKESLNKIESLKSEMEKIKTVKESVKGKIGISVLENLENKINEKAKEIEEIEKRLNEKIETVSKAPERVSEIPTEDIQKRIDELSQKFAEEAENIRKDFAISLEGIDKKLEAVKPENINSRIGLLEGKISEVNKIIETLKQIKERPTATLTEEVRKRLEDKLKLYALNSDLDRIWKLLEEQKNYVDEKTKYLESLEDQLKTWENRTEDIKQLQNTIEEKVKAFPELKVFQGRIESLEKTITELRKHILSVKISQPIVLE